MLVHREGRVVLVGNGDAQRTLAQPEAKQLLTRVAKQMVLGERVSFTAPCESSRKALYKEAQRCIDDLEARLTVVSLTLSAKDKAEGRGPQRVLAARIKASPAFDRLLNRAAHALISRRKANPILLGDRATKRALEAEIGRRVRALGAGVSGKVKAAWCYTAPQKREVNGRVFSYPVEVPKSWWAVGMALEGRSDESFTFRRVLGYSPEIGWEHLRRFNKMDGVTSDPLSEEDRPETRVDLYQEEERYNDMFDNDRVSYDDSGKRVETRVLEARRAFTKQFNWEMSLDTPDAARATRQRIDEGALEPYERRQIGPRVQREIRFFPAPAVTFLDGGKTAHVDHHGVACHQAYFGKAARSGKPPIGGVKARYAETLERLEARQNRGPKLPESPFYHACVADIRGEALQAYQQAKRDDDALTALYVKSAKRKAQAFEMRDEGDALTSQHEPLVQDEHEPPSVRLGLALVDAERELDAYRTSRHNAPKGLVAKVSVLRRALADAEAQEAEAAQEAATKDEKHRAVIASQQTALNALENALA